MMTAMTGTHVRRAGLSSLLLIGLIAAAWAPPETTRGQSRRGGIRDKKGDAKAREKQLEEALRRQTLKVNATYCKDLGRVLSWAVKAGLLDEAKDVYRKIRSVDREYEDLEKLKSAIVKAKKPPESKDLSGDRKTLEKKLQKVNADHAKRLYNFAVKCFKFGLFTRSYHLFNQVLSLAPDPRNTYQKKTRNVLGFEWDRKNKKWVSEWEHETAKKHLLTEEGWVETKHRKKWEAGQRPYKGKWVSVEREKEIRRRNEFNPFRVESEHFEVLTNLGRKEAWEYATILERFQRGFYETFIGYYDQIAGAKLLFKKGKPRKHKVYVFPSRVDYLNHVKGEQGNRKMLRERGGFYSPADRVSRFYWKRDIESTLTTLFHEVAHQLFAESKETGGGSQGNNWVVEGLATYVETCTAKGGKWRPGRRTDIGVMRNAREILEFRVGHPRHFNLRKFAAMGHREFQHEDRKEGKEDRSWDHYSLACALTHFLMHHDDEVYKEDFMRLVSAFYGGKVREDSLVDFVQVEGAASRFSTLEKQFRRYMAKLKMRK